MRAEFIPPRWPFEEPQLVVYDKEGREVRRLPLSDVRPKTKEFELYQNYICQEQGMYWALERQGDMFVIHLLEEVQ